MERRESFFIHGLVKSPRHARSSCTLILANSTGGGVQHCPFLVVLVLKHRLTGHTLPPPKLSQASRFSSKGSLGTQAKRKECCPPTGPSLGMMGELVLWAVSQSLPFCFQDAAGADRQGSGGATPASSSSGLHQFAPAEDSC